MRLQVNLRAKVASEAPIVSVDATKVFMSNIKLLTLRLARDYDSWMQTDSEMLACTLAHAAGFAFSSISY